MTAPRPMGVNDAERKRADSAQLLTQRQVADLLAVSVRTVRDLPLRRVRLSERTIRYRLIDVERFIERHAGVRKGAA